MLGPQLRRGSGGAPIQAAWASQGPRVGGGSTAGRSFFLCWSPRARATSLRATAVFVCGLSFARRRSSKRNAPWGGDLNARLWPLLPATQRPQRPSAHGQMLVRGGHPRAPGPRGVLTNPITPLRPPCFSVAAVLILSTPCFVGPFERESKSGWDTWSSWINRQDVYCPQEVWDKDHVIHKNVDRLSRLLPGQFCQPLLCSHGKLASKSPPRAFWKERKGEEMSFIRHLLCAPHRCGHVCQAFLFTPVLISQRKRPTHRH